MFWNRKKKPAKKDELSEIDKVVPADQSNVSAVSKQIPLSVLKQLVPVGDMADYELQQLELKVSSHKAGEVVFKLNTKSFSVPYLIEGQCFVETVNGSGYLVEAGTFKAFYPLNNSSNYQCNIIAKTDLKVLHCPENILNLSSQHIRNPLLNSQDIPEHLVGNKFFDTFCRYFKEDKLIIPSLPDVALKLRTAIQKDIGIHEAVKIINLDSVIASRLIQIVNSPLYRGVNPITNCHDAVARLGLEATRSLVTSISLQNLYRGKNKHINNKILMLWKQSIQVSSISYTLATITKKVIPDEALLAGLTHNVGALPIVIFADSLSNDDYSMQDLEQTITALQGLIGILVLKRWEFPEHLQETPKNIEKWFSSEGKDLNISDIVLLAKFHSCIGTKHLQKLPPIQTLPAYQKLGDGQLTPDMSLQTLQDAKQQIAEAMSLFKAG